MPIYFLWLSMHKKLNYFEQLYNYGIIGDYTEEFVKEISNVNVYMFHEFSEEVVYEDACITFEQFDFYSQMACE